MQFVSFASKIIELLLNKEINFVEYKCLTIFLWHSPRCKRIIMKIRLISLSVYKQSWSKVKRTSLLFPDQYLTDGKVVRIFSWIERYILNASNRDRSICYISTSAQFTSNCLYFALYLRGTLILRFFYENISWHFNFNLAIFLNIN